MRLWRKLAVKRARFCQSSRGVDQEPPRARPCGLVSGHPWPPTFLVNPPQTLTRVLTLRSTCGGRDKQAQDLLPPWQGVSKARDGLRQAHTDVLVASPCRGSNRACKACLLLPLPLRQRRIYGPLPFCNVNVVVNLGCSHIYGLFLVTCHLAWMNSAQ